MQLYVLTGRDFTVIASSRPACNKSCQCHHTQHVQLSITSNSSVVRMLHRVTSHPLNPVTICGDTYLSEQWLYFDLLQSGYADCVQEILLKFKRQIGSFSSSPCLPTSGPPQPLNRQMLLAISFDVGGQQ